MEGKKECFHFSVWSSLAVLAGLFQKLDQTEDVGKDDTAESLMRAHKGEGPQTQYDKLIFFPPGHHTRKIQCAVVNKDDRGLIYHPCSVQYTLHGMHHDHRDTCIGFICLKCKCLQTIPWLWLTYTNAWVQCLQRTGRKANMCLYLCKFIFSSLIFCIVP